MGFANGGSMPYGSVSDQGNGKGLIAWDFDKNTTATIKSFHKFSLNSYQEAQRMAQGQMNRQGGDDGQIEAEHHRNNAHRFAIPVWHCQEEIS